MSPEEQPIEFTKTPPGILEYFARNLPLATVKWARQCTGRQAPDGLLGYKILTMTPSGRKVAYVLIPQAELHHRVDLNLPAAEVPAPVSESFGRDQAATLLDHVDRIHFSAGETYYRYVLADKNRIRFSSQGTRLDTPGLE